MPDTSSPAMCSRMRVTTARPPAANVNLQQRVFNTFQQTYNELRPHEALDDETPASRWAPSARPYPERIAPPTYPAHLELRRISNAGTFRLHCGQKFLSQALNGETIGLEEVHDGLWNILYYSTLLGRYDERTNTITGARSLKTWCEPCLRTFCHLAFRLFSLYLDEATRRQLTKSKRPSARSTPKYVYARSPTM